ncbi:putative haloacid dehydrogenase (HAD) [Aromatoleum bremense]|nr:putative haloacid dehydrogenase (HAD) [Aromatoleum bremense]
MTGGGTGAPADICFLSSNAWDAYSAKAFGLRVLWCNRFGQAAERIPATPDGEIGDLCVLPPCLGLDGATVSGRSPL